MFKAPEIGRGIEDRNKTRYSKINKAYLKESQIKLKNEKIQIKKLN